MKIKAGYYTATVTAHSFLKDRATKKETCEFLCMIENFAWNSAHYHDQNGWRESAESDRAVARAMHAQLKAIGYYN